MMKLVTLDTFFCYASQPCYLHVLSGTVTIFKYRRLRANQILSLR